MTGRAPVSGWARLSAGLIHDRAWLGCGAPGRLVFVTSIALAKASQDDGLISLRAMIGVQWGALEPGQVVAASTELVEAGLWDPTDDPDVFRVRSFLRWNESQSQIDRRRDQKRVGALVSHHKRGIHSTDPHPDCPECVPPGGSATARGSARGGVQVEHSATAQVLDSASTCSDGDVDGDKTRQDPPQVSRSTKESHPQAVDNPEGGNNGTKHWKQAWQDVTNAIQRHGAQTFLTATREHNELDPTTWAAANTARQAIRYSTETDAMYRFRDAYERTP